MVTLEGGKKYEPKPDDPVHCELHGRWGGLDPVQQLAVEEGLDIDGPKCILTPSHNPGARRLNMAATFATEAGRLALSHRTKEPAHGK